MKDLCCTWPEAHKSIYSVNKSRLGGDYFWNVIYYITDYLLKIEKFTLESGKINGDWFSKLWCRTPEISPLKWVSTWRTLTGWAQGPDKRTRRDADVERWLHLKRNGEECCPCLCCDYQIIYNSSLCCTLQRCVPLDAKKVGVSEECLLYAVHQLRNQNQKMYWFPGGGLGY